MVDSRVWVLILYLLHAVWPAVTALSCPNSDWQAQCWPAVEGFIQLGINNTLLFSPYSSSRWGNTLSPYWQARGLAHLAGGPFDAFAGFNRDWLQHLPHQLPPTACPDPAAFTKACKSCSNSWEYPHRCPGPWTLIRPQIQVDTQAALRRWFEKAGKQLPTFASNDVVIQLRCASDTLLVHGEFGPVAFSFYQHIPPKAARIIIMRDTTITLPVCLHITQALQQHLMAAFPKAAISVQGSDRHSDFAAMVFAPYFFRDSQSSFGLWAGVANSGQVWSVPMLPQFAGRNTQPELGPGWHWVDVPVLYPAVGRAAGISKDDIAGIVRWLQTH